MNYNPKRIKYIEENINLIDNSNWEEFFDNAPLGVGIGGILYEADIPFMEELGCVPRYAFYDCRSLTSVNIPNNVTSIEECAFGFCQSLKSIIIPGSVTSIDKWAFFGCTALNNIQYKGTLKEWNSIDLKSDVFRSCPVEYIQCIDGKALI